MGSPSLQFSSKNRHQHQPDYKVVFDKLDGNHDEATKMCFSPCSHGSASLVFAIAPSAAVRPQSKEVSRKDAKKGLFFLCVFAVKSFRFQVFLRLFAFFVATFHFFLRQWRTLTLPSQPSTVEFETIHTAYRKNDRCSQPTY